jgi:predicted metal-binding membrane protein
MMAAMMFPSIAPTIALYPLTRLRSPLLPLLFAAGYLLTWAAADLLAFLIPLVAAHGLGDVFAQNRAGQSLAGAMIVIAAVYELTPLDDVCLGKCLACSAPGATAGRAHCGWASRTAPGALVVAGR